MKLILTQFRNTMNEIVNRSERRNFALPNQSEGNVFTQPAHVSQAKA